MNAIAETKRNRYRPTTQEANDLRDQLAEAERNAAILDRALTIASERIARHPKWCALAMFIGFMIGGLAVKAFS